MRFVNFVDGEVREPISGRFETNYEPSTGKALGEVAFSNASDVEAAYEAAQKAYPGWASLSLGERTKRLRAWAASVRQHADELSLVEARDTGTPRRSMLNDILKGANKVDYFCNTAYELRGETIPATAPDNLHYTRREPYGVVGIIIPFNHPAMFSLSKTAAALVAGNTVVLKPSELTPMTALRIAELSREHLPPGVFNVVQGGPGIGRAIVRHPDIWRIAFTGGVATALQIIKESAESGRIKHTTFELGGKNPLIAYPDVDVATAAEAAVAGMNYTRCQGQSCGSTSRLFVHRDSAQDVVEAIIERVRKIKLGLPEDEETEMGSLVSRQHQQRVLSYIDSGEGEGARLLYGGKAPDGPLAAGAYVEPTVFDQVEPGMRIAQEEIFGPVLSVITWNDEDTMLRAVNQVEYGLTAAVYTNDISTAIRAANRIQAGYVWINGIERRYIGVPFGGYKNSGLGTENNYEELLSYTREKAVNVMVQG